MPVSTGQVSFQDIADEFGGTTPHTLSEYYRGNGLVNSSITEIPSSGSPISVGSFRGLSAEVTITFTITGGGGCGGNGFDDGNGGASFRQGTGLASGIMTKSSYDTFINSPAGNDIITGSANSDIPEANFIQSVGGRARGAGGLGGINGGGAKEGAGGAGESTEFGAGGVGGGRNTAGSPPVWGNWGAAGGAGGGDADSYFIPWFGGIIQTDQAGWAGSPGSRGTTYTDTAIIQPGEYAVIAGRGGGGLGGGNYAGGRGQNGIISSLTFSNLPGKKFQFRPPQPSSSGGTQAYLDARVTTYVSYFTLTPTSITYSGGANSGWIVTDV